MCIKVRPFNKDSIPKLHSKLEYNPKCLPLDLEIGCGVGYHPIQYALQNPDRYLIAIEHTKEKFEKFYRRFLNHDSPQNLLAIHANGISWTSQLIENESLENVFLLYPNPNPKNLQKRWHAMPFMHELLAKLKAGGRLHLATNEDFYYKEAKEYFENFWKLEPELDQEYQGPARSHFEKKYLARNQTCYNLVYKKPI